MFPPSLFSDENGLALIFHWPEVMNWSSCDHLDRIFGASNFSFASSTSGKRTLRKYDIVTRQTFRVNKENTIHRICFT